MRENRLRDQTFLGDQIVPELHCSDNFTTLCTFKKHRILHFKKVNLIEILSYVNFIKLLLWARVIVGSLHRLWLTQIQSPGTHKVPQAAPGINA